MWKKLRRQRQIWRKAGKWITILTVMMLLFPFQALAADEAPLPPAGPDEDMIAMDFPVAVEEWQPFDFILDPERLIYETGAVKYGGGIVEAGATLLFHNAEGDYDFSRYSDYLDIKNRSTFPVNVTISARVSDLGKIELAETDDFSANESACIYLALTDSEGNIQPLSAEGEVSITFQMPPALEDAGSSIQNEDFRSIQDEMAVSLYSFGLTGACNPNADWQNVDVHPVVTVAWSVEPVQQDVSSGDESANLQSEGTVLAEITVGYEDDNALAAEGKSGNVGNNSDASDSNAGWEDDNADVSDGNAGQEGDNTDASDNKVGRADDNTEVPHDKASQEDNKGTGQRNRL